MSGPRGGVPRPGWIDRMPPGARAPLKWPSSGLQTVRTPPHVDKTPRLLHPERDRGLRTRLQGRSQDAPMGYPGV